jgi:hypothetical protein
MRICRNLEAEPILEIGTERCTGASPVIRNMKEIIIRILINLFLIAAFILIIIW